MGFVDHGATMMVVSTSGNLYNLYRILALLYPALFYVQKKDSPGPVMVSKTLCPAVFQVPKMCTAGQSIADHYWPWAIFTLM